MKRLLLTMLLLCSLTAVFSQPKPAVTISGKLTDQHSGEAITGASIKSKMDNNGTITGPDGSFQLKVSLLPATLLVSHVNFENREIRVDEQGDIEIRLVPFSATLNAVVIAGHRTPTRSMESHVTVEQLGWNRIRHLPTSAYEATTYLKGIDLTTSSLTFKTPSTRGFNGSGSTRVNQVLDGMDNQAPGLNFFVGNFAGPTELDIESIELLPGASSALYGPGGMNGTVLINTKNPFQYEGLSFQAKQGLMHIDKSQRSGASPYYDYSIRWAKAFKNKLAFKIGAQYLSATDWLANDSSNYDRSSSNGKLVAGTRMTDPNYDGVNVYGDETSVDVRQFIGGIANMYPAGSPEQLGILQLYNSMSDPTPVSRTGYHEKDIIDPETKSIKLSGAIHYKLTDKLEAQLSGNWAKGNTVYTGNNRYVLKGVNIGQYKLELKNKNWFLRAYTTQEDAGEAYSATVTAQFLNEAWKPSYNPAKPLESWYIQYAGAYIQARTQHGLGDISAHNLARSVADQGRPVAGSAAFKQFFDQVRKVPIPAGGLFLEKSQLWMTEGQYNFSHLIKPVEIIVGANYKKYILNSEGTLFIDTLHAITINETGAYAQVTKKMLGDRLSLSVSGRYDKNENFKGHFTPRATALIKLGNDNNIRFSYQTAYRFPSTQQQWIRLDVGEYTILGGMPWVLDYMHTKEYTTIDLTTGAPLEYRELKPETMRSFETGYKGIIDGKLLIDAYAYMGKYEDFLGRIGLYQPQRNEVYSIVVNSTNKVKTYGFGLGLDYRMPSNFSVFLNAYSDDIADVPSGFQSYFNTPRYRLNAGIANSGIGKSKRVSFNTMVRWQDAFTWDGELANGPLKAFTTVDAQVSYAFPQIKSVVRFGGTNILNHYYQNGYGNPKVGGMYYVMYAYNLFK